MSTKKLPVLAVTVGDVAGIGPEITAKMLLNHPGLRNIAKFVVIGDVAALRKPYRAEWRREQGSGNFGTGRGNQRSRNH